MVMPDQLITTKLYIPKTRPKLVSRPRLGERINAGLSGKMTLISAPAGYGKTTLLSEWAEIKHTNSSDGAAVTLLRVTLIDQAALQGIVSRLGALNLPLISVNRVDDQRAGQPLDGTTVG